MRKLTRDDVMAMEAAACEALLQNKLADYRTFVWAEFRSNPERDAWLCERFRLSVYRMDDTVIVGQGMSHEVEHDASEPQVNIDAWLAHYIELPAADLHLAVLRASLLCLLAEEGT